MISTKKLFRTPLLALAVLLLAGCGEFPADERARQLARDYYQALAAGDTARALSYFSPGQRPGKWQAHLDHLQSTLGRPSAYRETGMETNSPYRGRFYTLDFSTRYSNGQVAAETLTFFNSGDDERLDLVAHEVRAEGFE